MEDADKINQAEYFFCFVCSRTKYVCNGIFAGIMGNLVYCFWACDPYALRCIEQPQDGGQLRGEGCGGGKVIRWGTHWYREGGGCRQRIAVQQILHTKGD